MKRRLLLIITAAMLLVGCDEAAESAPETAEQTTAAQTTIAVPVHTEGTLATERPAPVGGVSLTDDHKELREMFSGADEYCDYAELGLTTTVCDDLIGKAKKFLESLSDFDTDYEYCRFGSVLGADDGCFYFSVVTGYMDIVDGYEMYDRFRRDYFCYDCDVDELTIIYPTNGFSDIECISNEVIVLSNDTDCAAVNKLSGFIAELPDSADNFVLVDDMVYFQHIKETDDDIVTTSWLQVGEKASSGGSTHYFDQSMSEYTAAIGISVPEYPDFVYDYGGLMCRYSIRRGVYNIVCNENDNKALALNGSSYLVYEPRNRVCDLIDETYYSGAVMSEKNLLGYRTRFSVFDRDYNEYVLGYRQTEEQPVDIKFHATKDGVMFLGAGDIYLILLAEPDDLGNVRAAAAPEELFATSDGRYIYNAYHSIRCDNGRLYFFDDYCSRLVTIHR